MKAYVTSIGERTTEICVRELQRVGFEVELLDLPIPWHEKYMAFLTMAKMEGKPCIRVDADVIVNDNIRVMKNMPMTKMLMAQCQVFDLHKNDLHWGGPIYYSPESFDIILGSFRKLERSRPETSAWRLPKINGRTMSVPDVVGMHGFYQDLDTIKRGLENKVARKQITRHDADRTIKLELLK